MRRKKMMNTIYFIKFKGKYKAQGQVEHLLVAAPLRSEQLP